MNRRKWLLGIGGALAIAVVSYLLRQPVRDYLIDPTNTFVWYLSQIYAALPQKFVWAISILAGVIFGINILRRTEKRRHHIKPEMAYYPNRVELWEKWLRDAGKGSFYKFKLSTEMGDLLLRTVAARSQIGYNEARRRLLNGETAAPPVAVKLVNHSYIENEQAFLRQLRRRFRRGDNQDEIYRQMDTLVRYLERELEV